MGNAVVCSVCGLETLPGPTEFVFRECHGKEEPIDLKPAAEKLGITAADVANWANALTRWTRAKFPTRMQEEVKQILDTICKPCEHYADGRCRKCGCCVNTKPIAVFNKIKMKTEQCPIGKW